MEYKREIYLDKLINREHNGIIKVITGLRRCGKSYLLFTIFKRHLISRGVDTAHIIEIPFDDFEFKRYRANVIIGQPQGIIRRSVLTI